LRRLAIALVALAAVLGLGAVRASAQPAPAPGNGAVPPVDVFEVSGLVDHIVVDGIEKAIARAETDGAQALVLQMNTKGAVVSRDRMARLAARIHDAAVPVTIWVGPSTARANGTPGQLLGAAAVSGMGAGTRIGHFGDPLQVPGVTLDFGAANAQLRDGSLGADDAHAEGALRLGPDQAATPVLRNFVGSLDGLQYQGHTVQTRSVGADGTPTVIAQARLSKLGLTQQLFHTVASPPVSYLLLSIGLALLVFEFFTAGVGIAGVVGAVCVFLGCYGVAVLPTRWWALALLVLAMLAFAIDVQTGVPRFWTGVGVVAFVVASVFLFAGHPLSWITLLVGIGGMLLAFLTGMPSMVRSRFATPTIGREWMVGELGEAVVAVDPDGVVLVREAQWRARTNRATPIASGERVRVVAIDGVTLEVEPEAGGARDYRERRARS
jgi:membrane-bound serine protease (ClpP class)